MCRQFHVSARAFFARTVLTATILLLGLSTTVHGQSAYQVTDLVSDVINAPFGPPQVVDLNLKNPWGMSFSATSPFWVADQRTGVATLYSGDTLRADGTRNPILKVPLTVTIPPAPGRFPGSPTGTVFNGTSDFVIPSSGQPARFLFASLDGTITGWNGGISAVRVATTLGAAYTGLALGNNEFGNFLFAANVAAGSIDVFDRDFNPVIISGGFIDPDLPDDFAPFNIQNLHGELYVAYRCRTDPEHDGVVDVFDTRGNFSRRIASGGPLNAPWGLALAPDNFGFFSGALLVGNFGLGDGRINGFDPQTGDFLGQVSDSNGNPIVLERLWALAVGNGGAGGSSGDIYFTAGINNQQDGLFGRISVINDPHP